jgi:hypothetical protein
MTQHTYCGVTFSLITGDGLGERIDRIQDLWGPDWRDDPVKRLVMETLSECEHFIDHYEDAARMRASPWRNLKSAPSGEVIMFCDARGNRWIDVHPGHPANSLGYPPTCWMPLPEGPSSSPSPIDHSNDSARHNGTSETASSFADPTIHAKAFHKMAAALCCPPAAEDEPDQRARNAGVGA